MSSPRKRTRSSVPKSSQQTESEIFLRPSAHQLRKMWDHDNSCASKYMRIPKRICSTTEPPDQPGVSGMSKELMAAVLDDIEEMWKRVAILFEVFIESDNTKLGYRIRVKKELPMKISMKYSDNITFGWRAVFTDGCASEHLYLRSDLELNNQYLGGPISYVNYACGKLANISASQVSHGSARHLVKVESKGRLQQGVELLWCHGSGNLEVTFDNESWSKPECCAISDVKSSTYLSGKRMEETFEDLCVLCGKPYREKKNPDRKAQKKVHLLNSHVDFLGSDWNGCGRFDDGEYEISYDTALLEAERLNRLLSRLNSCGWKVVPACVVAREVVAGNETNMTDFRSLCKRLRPTGIVVLRGRTAPSVVEHFQPVRPSRWDILFSAEKKPPRVYAMSKAECQDKEDFLSNVLKQDMALALGIDYDEGEVD